MVVSLASAAKLRFAASLTTMYRLAGFGREASRLADDRESTRSMPRLVSLAWSAKLRGLASDGEPATVC